LGEAHAAEAQEQYQANGQAAFDLGKVLFHVHFIEVAAWLDHSGGGLIEKKLAVGWASCCSKIKKNQNNTALD
jgi:hypothetical protein